MARPYRATLAGQFSVKCASGSLLLPRARKAKGILAYLAGNHGKPIAREKLIDLMWSDRDMSQGQSSLRQAIFDIRTALGPTHVELLDIGRTSIYFRSDAVHFDIWSDQGALKVDCPDPLFEDLDSIAPVFDDWLGEFRRSIRAAQVSLAERLLERSDLVKDATGTLELAEHALRLDPYNERASCTAMSCLAAMGKPSRVRDEFARLSAALAADGLEVQAGTLEHFQRLESAPTETVAFQTSTKPKRVLPRLRLEAPVMVGDTPLLQVVAVEVLDRLNLCMTRVPEVCLVDGRTSEVAAPAEYRLSVQVSGIANKVTCTIRVTETLNESSVWSIRETFETAANGHSFDHFCDLCAARIVQEVENLEGLALLDQREGIETGAYEFYLKAKRVFQLAETQGYMDKVQELLERAIADQPNFLPAYLQLIQSYNTGTFMTRPGVQLAQGRLRALELTERLLALDNTYPGSHIAMAWCQMWKGNGAAAERSIDTAIELAPHEAHRLNSIGTALVYLGRANEGLDYYERARCLMLHELDYQRTDYGELYYFLRDFDRAMEWLSVGEVRLKYRTHFWRIPTLAQLDRLDEAKRECAALVESAKSRWCADEPCTAERVVRWYLQTIYLRRQIDRDVLRDGFERVGITL